MCRKMMKIPLLINDKWAAPKDVVTVIYSSASCGIVVLDSSLWHYPY